jgi:lipocalin
MKNSIKSIFFTQGIATGSFACDVKPVLTTVPSVHLNRYLGTWYELASYPQFSNGAARM